MTIVDLHTHTRHSHGKDGTRDNLLAALDKGVAILGFTEHTPRPKDFTYPSDYQDRLARRFPVYVDEVRALKEEYADQIRVLVGAEFDFFPGYEDAIRAMMDRYAFDYTIGSVHFLEHWGFDFSARDWKDLDEGVLFQDYQNYFSLLRTMCATGLFDIAAHLDLIKIFSIAPFSAWAATRTAREAFGNVLAAMAEQGMALEVSSAGLRKPCREIYPCPPIMRLARDMGVPITFASDAHTARDVAHGFDTLVQYAASFGFDHHVVVDKGEKQSFPL